MNRRRMLAAVGSVIPPVFAGCLSEFSDGNGDDDEDADPGGVEPRDLPKWTDAESPEAVTTYAAEYKEAVEHNRDLDQLDEDAYYETLSHSCSGAFEAETSAGDVVLLSCFQTATVSSDSGDTYVSEGSVGPFAVLANEEDVIDAVIPNYREASLEIEESSPSTRGLVVVNFSLDERPVEITIENESASDADDPVFEESFVLDPETGAVKFQALHDPGSYTVSVTADDATDEDATHDWDVPDEPREWTDLGVTSTFDLALGVYVLPDGTVEIRESTEDRATA